MKIDMKDHEDVRLSHDHEQCGFMIFVADNYVHVRAKHRDELGHEQTTIVIDARRVEVAK